MLRGQVLLMLLLSGSQTMQRGSEAAIMLHWRLLL